MDADTKQIEVILQLREQPWVNWKSEKRNGRLTKIPYRSGTDKQASSTDPATWSSYEAAFNAMQNGHGYSGLGTVFTDDKPYSGVDLDDCINEMGTIASWAAEIITSLDSYTEVSPSGTGVKIWVKGKLPQGNRCRRKIETGEVEMYSRGRYFTVTSQHLEGTPTKINDRNTELNDLYLRVFKDQLSTKTHSTNNTSTGFTGDDTALIEKARNAKNGAKFKKLFDDGDLSGHGDDHSSADAALLSILAFWTGCSPDSMERLFSKSALGQRDKWTDRQDYRNRSIKAAIDRCSDDYHGTEPWPEIIPLDEEFIPSLPDNPPEAIRDLYDYCLSVAEHVQIDPGAVFFLALAFLASASGGKLEVQTNGTHTEKCNLFAVPLASTGHRKTAVFRELLRPIAEMESMLRQQEEPTLLKNRSKKKSLEKKLAEIEKSLAKLGCDNTRELETKREAICEEIANFAGQLWPTTCIIKDATPTAVVQQAARNNGQLLITGDEGGMMQMFDGKFDSTAAPDNGIILNGYDGGSYEDYRVGRDSFRIDAANFSIGLIFQEVVFTKMKNYDYLDKTGFIPRLCLIKAQNRLGGRTRRSPKIDLGLQEAYCDKIKELFAYRPGQETVLTLSSDADEVAEAIWQSIEPKLKDPDRIVGWLAKHYGRIARIAGILHSWCHSDLAWNEGQRVISGEIMAYATKLGFYLEDHAELVIRGMARHDDLYQAKRVLEAIRGHDGRIIRTRWILRKLMAARGSIRRTADLADALELLELHGYIRPRGGLSAQTGVPREYEVRPENE